MAANPSIQLGTDGNWAIKEDNLLAYKKDGTRFFNKEFDFTRNTTATFVDKNGLIKQSNINTPRIDFTDDATGYLLLEPQSTNLVTDSAGGSYGNNPGSEILTTAPDGTNTAVRPVPDSTSDRYQYSVSGGSYATDSKLTYTWYRKRISTPSNTQYTGDLRFNSLVNCTQIGSTTEIASNINGYDRFSATFNITDGSLETLIRGYFGQSIGVGNSSIAYWGHQVEALSYSTSLIQTNGSTATRNAEVCNNSGSAQDFNSEEGVLYAEIAALDNDGTNRILGMSNGGDFNNSVLLRFSSVSNRIQAQVRLGGVYQCSLNYDVTDANEFNKIAFKYKQNDFSLYVNGVERATDTSGNVITGLDVLDFDISNTNEFYGKTKNLKVFKRAMSDEELQQLTT